AAAERIGDEASSRMVPGERIEDGAIDGLGPPRPPAVYADGRQVELPVPAFPAGRSVHRRHVQMTKRATDALAGATIGISFPVMTGHRRLRVPRSGLADNAHVSHHPSMIPDVSASRLLKTSALQRPKLLSGQRIGGSPAERRSRGTWIRTELQRPVPRIEPMGSVGSRRSMASIMHQDRKSTRLNSSHVKIAYAVFCLKKKNT